MIIKNFKIFEKEKIKDNIVYIANFVKNPKELKNKYKPVHENEFYHHSTVEFKPKITIDEIKDEIGKEEKLEITGRLTTENVDVLIVKNPRSKNNYPHITLSTSNKNGKKIPPFQSNSEIKNNLDKIEKINDSVETIFGFFNGKKDILDI